MSNTEERPFTDEEWQKFPEFMRQHPEIVEADGALLDQLVDGNFQPAQLHVEEHPASNGEVWRTGHVHLSLSQARALGIQGFDRFAAWLQQQK